MTVGQESVSRGSKKRLRRLAAEATLRRVAGQREEFTNQYAQATTSQERFGVVADELRAAAADGRHQADPDETKRRLDQITTLMRNFLMDLYDAQEANADKVIRRDDRRIARNERRGL
jgi:hypothetical protein